MEFLRSMWSGWRDRKRDEKIAMIAEQEREAAGKKIEKALGILEERGVCEAIRFLMGTYPAGDLARADLANLLRTECQPRPFFRPSPTALSALCRRSRM